MTHLRSAVSAPLVLVVALVCVPACATLRTTRPVADAQTAAAAPGTTTGDRTATLLAINDVYRIEGLDDGALGGLARVRALRQELERSVPDLLMLHGGDFLFPSFASRMYRGEQMVSVLNALDGDETGFDSRMFAVIGNHEFERSRLKDAAFLKERIDGSQFRWLGANVNFAKGADGLPLVASKNFLASALVESGGIRIGIIGLTIPVVGVEYVSDFAGEQAAAREQIAALKAQKAEVIIALTHLNASNDRKLLEALGDSGLDLIIGGHDHEAMRFQVNGRWVLKADADVRTATIVRLTKKADGTLMVKPELRKVGGDFPKPDPAVQQLVDRWQARHSREFCAAANEGPACLDEVYGRTSAPLEAEENKIRGRETSLGDWATDLMMNAFKGCGAQAAFVNAGSLRLNRDIGGGSSITRRLIEELFAYPAPLYLVKIDGATLANVADQAVRGWPGSGTWLQIAGFGYRHDTEARVASRLTWLSEKGPRPIGPTDSVLAVTSDFLINPATGDQDGYLMLKPGQIVQSCAANGVDLKALVIQSLKAAGPNGIAPKTEGRICQGGAGVPCLLPPVSAPVKRP